MRPEEQIQSAIVAYIEAVVPGAVVIAIPNAARRKKGGKAGNAVPGLKKGAPDLVVALPRGMTVWIEVKARKGRARQDQIDMAAALNWVDHVHVYARSIEDVRDALVYAGVETREAA